MALITSGCDAMCRSTTNRATRAPCCTSWQRVVSAAAAAGEGRAGHSAHPLAGLTCSQKTETLRNAQKRTNTAVFTPCGQQARRSPRCCWRSRSSGSATARWALFCHTRTLCSCARGAACVEVFLRTWGSLSRSGPAQVPPSLCSTQAARLPSTDAVWPHLSSIDCVLAQSGPIYQT